MSSTSEISQFAHDLGVVNIDGVVFRQKVTYYDEDGNKLQLTDEFLAQECSITGQVEKQLSNYVSALAKEHVKKSGKELKDTKLIIINSDEVSIDGAISKGHDFDLSEDTQKTLKTNLKQDIKTAAKTWELAHTILLNDFNHHIESASKPKLTFTGELDTTVKPHRAELSLHRIDNPQEQSEHSHEHILRRETPDSPPPPYESRTEESLGNTTYHSATPSAPPLVEETCLNPKVEYSAPPRFEEDEEDRKESLQTSAKPFVDHSASSFEEDDDFFDALDEDLTSENPSERVLPKTEETVATSGFKPVSKAMPHQESLKPSDKVKPKVKQKKEYKSLPQLLSELKGKDLKRLQPYLTYFHPFHWENVIELFKSFQKEEDKILFLANCEKLRQATLSVKASDSNSSLMLATDENLLNQLSPHERGLYRRVFKAIDSEKPSVHTENRPHQQELSEEQSQREKQIAKAKAVKLALALRKQIEKSLDGAEAVNQEEITQAHAIYKKHTEALERFATEQGFPQEEDEEVLEMEVKEKPKANQEVKLPVIVCYDKESETHSILSENTEELRDGDEDVKKAKTSIKSYLKDPNLNRSIASQRFVQSLNDIYHVKKNSSHPTGKTALDQIIERYQLHTAVLEDRYREVVEAEGLVFNMSQFIAYKAALDTEFKSLMMDLLREEILKLNPPSEADFFKTENKTIVVTDQAKAFLAQSSSLYFDTIKKLQTLGPAFKNIVEGLAATNGSDEMVSLDSIDLATKLIVSALDSAHSTTLSQDNNRSALNKLEAIKKAIESA